MALNFRKSLYTTIHKVFLKIRYNGCEKNMLKIDEFRMEMEEPKKIYTEELGRFSKKYDFLDEFTIVEEPDIDTVDYIYHFNNINGTSKEIINSARDEMYNHMVKFSKSNGIDDFSRNAHIFIKR